MEATNKFTSGDRDKDFLRVVVLDSSLTVCQALTSELRKDNHITIGCTSREEANRVISAQKPDLLIIGYLGEVSCLEVFRQYTSQSPDLPIVLISHTPEVNQFFREWVIAQGGFDVVSWFPERLSLLREVLQRLMHQRQSPKAKSSLEVQEVAAPTPKPSSPERISEKIAAPQTPQPSAAERIPSEISAPPTPSESLQPPAERALEVKLEVKEVATPAPKPIATSSSSALTCKQALIALNQISEASLIYFGGLVIGNYWKKAHASAVQAHPWLQSWSVNHNGAISYSSETNLEEPLTNEQFQSLKFWVKGFIKECDRIIGEYTELLQQSNPSEEVAQIIG